MTQPKNSSETVLNPPSRSPSGELGPDFSAPSLRDQFAMAALTGLVSNTFIASHLANMGGTADNSAKMFTHRAYAMADAMMESRKPKEDSDAA